MTKRMMGMIRMIINDTYKSAPSQKCNDGVEAKGALEYLLAMRSREMGNRGSLSRIVDKL